MHFDCTKHKLDFGLCAQVLGILAKDNEPICLPVYPPCSVVGRQVFCFRLWRQCKAPIEVLTSNSMGQARFYALLLFNDGKKAVILSIIM